MMRRTCWPRRRFLTAAGALAALPVLARGSWARTPKGDWRGIRAMARGQVVHFNGWGGDQRINDYIAWAAAEIKAGAEVEVRHVKLADTAEAVSRIIAEKAAGRVTGGSVDLIWINGENFAALKSKDLLFGPFVELLPNFRKVDPEEKPTTVLDFTVPTEGYESPWGMAQLVFFYDSARVKEPPRSMAALKSWAEANPGRFTYPAPPDFLGTTFLKQALYETTADPTRLLHPTGQNAAMATAPLWTYLDSLHPHLWRKGAAFPRSSSEMRQLVADGETDIYFAFNPGDASSAIAQDLLPDTVRAFVPSAGSIGNTHFLAIPFNSSAPEGAMVFADFLLSPEAQARKEHADVWGDPTVLSMARLEPEERKLFEDLPRGIATPTPEELGKPLPEPHSSWVPTLEQEWLNRYSA
ncbi:ABC transporter substrate-binding protein [Dongia deserti]|uniref:ABC transporter substrate-binding protein n=1 Tax=Dongia deserti TaxID=2268030 RepID=UPI00254834A3|nr:ABC transporter substrate-binding protein [Dongia deserti]